MKNILFLILTLLSILSFLFAGLLIGIYYSEENPGMIMVFLIPLLVAGLLNGVIAFLLKKIKKIALKQSSLWLHNLNLILIVLGIIALVYALSE